METEVNQKRPPKDGFLGIRVPAEMAKTIRVLAFMKGETLGDWLARVAAPELTAAGLRTFNVSTSSEDEK